jgi:hypothetical protein
MFQTQELEFCSNGHTFTVDPQWNVSPNPSQKGFQWAMTSPIAVSGTFELFCALKYGLWRYCGTYNCTTIKGQISDKVVRKVKAPVSRRKMVKHRVLSRTLDQESVDNGHCSTERPYPTHRMYRSIGALPEWRPSTCVHNTRKNRVQQGARRCYGVGFPKQKRKGTKSASIEWLRVYTKAYSQKTESEITEPPAYEESKKRDVTTQINHCYGPVCIWRNRTRKLQGILR